MAFETRGLAPHVGTEVSEGWDTPPSGEEKS